LVEYEYEYRDAEDEYEKKHEQKGAPKSPPVLSLFESWSPETSVTTDYQRRPIPRN
jgi:hypothetical protein